jgi:thiol-disulfide isomerase/thioredoxin
VPACLALVLLVVIGLTAACGTTTYYDNTPGQPAPTAGPGWQRTAPIALDLPTKDPITDGAVLPEGNAPVLVNIWASTCVPCKTELPLLQKIDTAGELRVVGFSRDIRTSDAAGALKKAGVTYPNWLDSDASIAVGLDGRIPINAIPSSVLIRDGKVVAVHIGAFAGRKDVLAALDIK